MGRLRRGERRTPDTSRSDTTLEGTPASFLKLVNFVLNLPVPAGVDMIDLALRLQADGGHDEVTAPLPAGFDVLPRSTDCAGGAKRHLHRRRRGRPASHLHLGAGGDGARQRSFADLQQRHRGQRPVEFGVHREQRLLRRHQPARLADGAGGQRLGWPGGFLGGSIRFQHEQRGRCVAGFGQRWDQQPGRVPGRQQPPGAPTTSCASPPFKLRPMPTS